MYFKITTSLFTYSHLKNVDLSYIMKVLEDVALSSAHFSTVLLSLQFRETPSVIATQFIITAIERMRTYNFLTLPTIAHLMKTKEQSLFVEQTYATNFAYLIWHLVSDVFLIDSTFCIGLYCFVLLISFLIY